MAWEWNRFVMRTGEEIVLELEFEKLSIAYVHYNEFLSKKSLGWERQGKEGKLSITNTGMIRAFVNHHGVFSIKQGIETILSLSITNIISTHITADDSLIFKFSGTSQYQIKFNEPPQEVKKKIFDLNLI